MKQLWDERYQPADAEIVKRKAARIACRSGFRRCEAEDVEQELATHVFQKTLQHDPDRGSREKFVSKVAKNKLLNLIERRNAQKRNDRRNIEYDEGPQGALIDGSMTSAQIDLQIEMRSLAAEMSPEVREVYELRLRGYSEADIVKHLHIGRQRVRTLLRRMEHFIRDAKLGDYVTSQPSYERTR